MKQLDFRNIHSTNQAPVSGTKEIRRAFYYDEFACGVTVYRKI